MGEIDTDNIEARSDNLFFTTHNLILNLVNELGIYGPGVRGIIRRLSFAIDPKTYTAPTHSPWLVAFVSAAGKIKLKSISICVRPRQSGRTQE